MNILRTKREQYVAELTKLAVSIDAEITEKVAAYKASLEAEGNEKMSKLRTIIEAIDVLINNVDDFDVDEVTRDSDKNQIAIDIVDTESQVADASLHSCFKKATNDQRPGMNSISVPLRQ